jgi:ATP-binding cassette subfamily F protein 3
MIYLQNLSKRYGGKHLLSNVTYHFPEGEHIALVGANGVGKTTLLDMITGLEEWDDGQIIKTANLKLGYLPQEPNPSPLPTILEECMQGASWLYALQTKRDTILQQMETSYSEELFYEYEKIEAAYLQQGGYALESEAKKFLHGLGFSAAQFDENPKSLSGGWRMRLELARLLLNKPNFLILDEPTNHLDLPSMIWLEDYLKTFEGTILFVSHDQDLLNRLSSFTLHLQGGNLTPYKGNFDSFLEQRELNQMQNAAEAKNIQNRYAHIEKFVERFRAKASKASQVRSRLKMMERLKALENNIQQEESLEEISLELKVQEPSGRQVLTLKEASIGYNKPLSKGLNLKIERGQKVAIIGANGIGKSTLLKSIMGHLPFLQGELTLGHNVQVSYFAQDQLDFLELKATVLENVLASNSTVSEREARSLLGGFLFQKDDVFKKVSVLSGGEKSRVGLCCLLMQKGNFLILDEPTNHLDMSSASILAQALSGFDGSLLFVSHNRSFINQVATHIFAMTASGRSRLFEGQLDDYETLAAKAGFPNVLKEGGQD